MNATGIIAVAGTAKKTGNPEFKGDFPDNTH